MRRAAVIAALVIAGCGGGGSGPAGPSSPQPSATSGVVAVEPITFVFEPGVTEADRVLITRGAATARTMFLARFGRWVGATTVDVRAGTGPFTAQGGNSRVTIYAGHENWTRISNAGRTKTVVHEFFHVLQGEVGWPYQPVERFFEGTAEYVGYAGAIEGGLTTYAAVRACEIDIYYTGGGAATPPLAEISFSLSSSVNSRYAVAWLGVDRLLGGLDGIARLRTFWEAAGSTEQRFLSAFGLTPLAFSNEFQTWRLSLPQGSGNACSSL